MTSSEISKPLLEPLKVYVVNPLAPATQLFIVKIMSGVVFGENQLIDMYLIVYTNNIRAAEAFILEIESCAFSCNNSIKVSSDIPRVTDGDVFCFMTDFDNPNLMLFHEKNIEDQFNALYLIIKLANSFSWPSELDDKEGETTKKINTNRKSNKHAKSEKSLPVKERKPIFLTDGLVAIDILHSMSSNMPSDIYFCPTPLTAITKSVLGDYLNVHCNVINDVLVWAANDDVFHIEVERPLIIHDEVDGDSHCNENNIIGKDLLESLNLDSTQFSASWLKKELIEKVASSASKNPYGCIYRAVEFSKTLRDIWLTRIHDDGKKVYNNMGVISDGSLGTIKGYAYVLPVVFSNGSWSVDKRFENDIHLKQEIKRMNQEVTKRHKEMISHCKKILHENIINQSLKDEDGSSFTSKY
ncbi:uncharacterized protein LOC124535409 [Vanessa cardui]|uniref:uncharacterized protein LOC124535409 n=1 Tax=Vanessa cardui TaxID=171605 RepID=UPI001F12D826|nr:uncharacterized protein LOC124535409 [Vanessa cardui]